MKSFRHFVIPALLACLSSSIQAQYAEGTLEVIKVYSHAIEANVYGDDANQDVAVYLPPTYNQHSTKKYPVLYFLPGYYDKIDAWTTSGHFQGFKLKENMDKMINEGAMKEIIVVIPNSFNFLEGAFYANSKANGNWEDFYVKELVNTITAKYRTLDDKGSRAIAGHSMGGSGALDLAMKYPDVYCMGYGLCSGLLAPNWVEESPVFGDEAAIRNSIDLWDTLATMNSVDAHTYYANEINRLRTTNLGWLQIFGYAYGSAFAGDSSLNAPYFEYPFSLEGDEIVTDSSVLANWEDGFGDLENKIEMYGHNIKSLKAYVLDYGRNDYWKYIVSGHEYYHQLLEGAEIPHTFIENGGDHESKVEQQFENSILWTCDSLLAFDWDNLNSEAALVSVSVNNQIGESIVDAANKKVTITLSADVNVEAIRPNIQASVGAKLEPASRASVDFSNGSVEYGVVAEDGQNYEIWTIELELNSSDTKQQSENKVNIYPNPFSNILSVNITDLNANRIVLSDLNGRQVISNTITSSEKIELNTADLVAGLYFIEIYNTEELVFHYQVVKL